MTRKPQVFLIAVIVLEAAAAVYLGFVAWLVAVWMVDDAVAARMQGVDWYFEAFKRGGLAIVIAVAFGGLAMLANRRWLAPRAPQWATGLRRLAIILASGIAVAGAAGALEFAWKKPFM
jgi:hypothetical protein